MRRFFKIPFEYALLYLQILFVALFVLVILASNLDIASRNFLGNRMFSENVQGIWLGDPRVDQKEDVTAIIPDIPNADFMMYKHLAEGYDIIRGVFGTSDVFGLSAYLASGRFFHAGDYEDKTDTAVVGHRVLPRTIEENGRRYLPHSGRRFEVIGVFRETDTVLDNTIYLNITSLLDTMTNLALYYIDAANIGTVERVIAALQSHAADQGFQTMLQDYDSGMTYSLGRGHNTMLLTAILASAMTMLITVIFFVTHKKYKVAVQKLYGMTKRDLALYYGKRIIAITLAAAISIVLVITFLTQYMGSFFAMVLLAAEHFYILGGVLMLLIVTLTFFIVRLTARVDISSALKGR